MNPVIVIVALMAVLCTQIPTHNRIMARSTNSVRLERYLEPYEYASNRLTKDKYKTPKEFFKSDTRDCTDYAVVVYEVLTHHGYDCTIYGMFSEDEYYGHCIVTYEKGEDIGYFSNNERIEGNIPIEDITFMYNYDFYVIIDWEYSRWYWREYMPDSSKREGYGISYID